MADTRLTLAEFFEQLGRLADVAAKHVAIGTRDSEAAIILRVLEFGSVAGQRPWPRPGPRTVRAIDPETGAAVVASAQAPQGFIRVRAAQFLDTLRGELTLPIDWLSAEDVQRNVERAGTIAAQKALVELHGAVPKAWAKFAQSLSLLSE